MADRLESTIQSSNRSNGPTNKSVEGLVETSDVTALRAHHEFVRDDSADEVALPKKWESRMARTYYDKLYKEYAVADLSRYQSGLLGLRWRVRDEVLKGIGSDICGGLSCGSCISLKTFEVPFRYLENEKLKAELVKLRLCNACAIKLKRIPSFEKQRGDSYSALKRKRTDYDM